MIIGSFCSFMSNYYVNLVDVKICSSKESAILRERRLA